MIRPMSPPRQPYPVRSERTLFSTDHKTVGIQYLLFSLICFAGGGVLSMLMRWQLAWPSDPAHPVPLLGGLLHWSAGVMPPEAYNQILSLHATIMVWFVVIPLLNGAFGNYLIPLKIGASGPAFPRLGCWSFWATVVAATVLVTGVLLPGGAASAGWTSYPPLAAIPFNGVGRIVAAPGWLHGLQPLGSTWPTIAVGANWLTLALLATAVAIQFLPTAIAIVLAAVAAAIAVRALQTVAFDGQACWYVSLVFVGVANLAGAVNFLATVATLRCRGMTMFRLPLTVWNLFITAFITLLATPVLLAVLVLSLLDHHGLTRFFEPAGWAAGGAAGATAALPSTGGDALLFPHLFWFYSHPAVYIMMLPAMGIVSDILPVFARKPLFGYRAMVWATMLIAVMGFVVWGHHLFQSQMNPALGTTFAFSSFVIAAPSGIKTFNWIATLWQGSIERSVPLLNGIAFVSLFVIGGLSGIILASSAVDVQLHMTYFVVAHIHYVLFGGSTFGIFAGIYYWYPKMFGRVMNPTLGYVHTVASYVTFNCTFFAMHLLGLEGLPRRLADYRTYPQWAHLQPLQQFITISAFALGLAQLPFVLNFFGSMVWGARAADNPWRSTTLEWTTPSPPPRDNFLASPVVRRGPYEYSSPQPSPNDFIPQGVVVAQ